MTVPLARSSRIQRQIITTRSSRTRTPTSPGPPGRPAAWPGAPRHRRSAAAGRQDETGEARSHPERAEPVGHAVGLRATNVRVSNRFFRILNSTSSVPVQRDERVQAGHVGEHGRSGKHIAPQPGGHTDTAHHALDDEAAIVEQLLHPPLGGHEVVGVVDVPEEGALLEVVGHDHEEHAARTQQTQRVGREGPRRIDARHVLHDLVGIDDVEGCVVARNRRRERLDHVQALPGEDVDQEVAGLDGCVVPASSHGKLAKGPVSWAHLDEPPRRLDGLLEQAEPRPLDAAAARGPESGELLFGKRLVERVLSHGAES